MGRIIPVFMLLALSAHAQAEPDAGQTRLIVARNQLGLAQYCHDRGMVADATLADARAVVAHLAAPAGVGDAEAAAGAQGTVAFGTSRVSLVADAAAEGITLPWRCRELALVAAAQAAR